MHTCTRYHDISCGHRVTGHEGKCKHLHGHNYRIHFECTSDKTPDHKEGEALDQIGRVIDFTVINKLLCQWLEEHWDHRMLMWIRDPMILAVRLADPSVLPVPFNPTAENMAQWLVEFLGPQQLKGTGVKLVRVTVEETAKCSATYIARGVL